MHETSDGTYGITGIPPPVGVTPRTKEIPFVPGLPLRLELSKLFPSKDPLMQKQWTLFILALERFKALPVDDKLSYFQIAGIHGYPQTAWDGAKPPSKDPADPDELPPGANPYGGYCNHNQLTFPMWHRPYMLLFEQLIWTHMNKVIEFWDLDKAEATEWQNARNTWRLPYWDWGRRQNYQQPDGTIYDQGFGLPYAFTLKEVPIYPPSGPKSDQPNPLWGFVNPERDSNGQPLSMNSMPKGKERWNIQNNGKLPWGECKGVSRYGIKEHQDEDTFQGLDGENCFERVNAHINECLWYNPYAKEDKLPEDKRNPLAVAWNETGPGSLADSVNRMFSSGYNQTWGHFASTKWWAESEQDNHTGYLSLEYIHNSVHNIAGGSHCDKAGLGHMSDVPVAAFDPLFWMHHCNIDRLCATWQVLNWNKWWDSEEPSGKTSSNIEDRTPDDFLEPFHTKDNGDVNKDVWTSNGVRDWTKLHYQYDDLVPKPNAILSDGTLDEDQYKIDLTEFIQDTYPSTSSIVKKALEHPDAETKKFFGDHHIRTKSWNDYAIDVVYDRYALAGRSYTIQFWLKPDETMDDKEEKEVANLLEYTPQPIMIGQVYSLGGLSASNTGSGCPNCKSQNKENVLSKGQVPITIPLIARAMDDKVKSLNTIRRIDIEKHLRDHLYWKFIETGGFERQAQDFPDTKISILRGEGKLNQDSKTGHLLPPLYSTYEPIYTAEG